MTIAVLPHTDADIPQAAVLATRLNLPQLPPQNPKTISDYAAVLRVAAEGLGLQQCGPDAPGPVVIDFTGGAVDHRRKFGGGKGQMIAKAVGLQHRKQPTVLDATAGLGRDAFVLASLGCTVDLVERSPIVHALLEDALKRTGDDPEVALIVARMRLHHANAVEYLKNAEPYDVVYLDPMFPVREKSAAVKKEMQVFHHVIGHDPDSDALLPAALENAIYRVVVKRPRTAPVLAGIVPSFALEGKANRFDVYVRRGIRSSELKNCRI